MLDREALDAADVDRRIDDGPAAVVLTGVLAHEAADRREGVVPADQAHGVLIPLLAHQGDVAGDVHVRGTERGARDALEVRGAAALVHVGEVVVLEGDVAVQDHLGGLEADGAVGAVHDGLGGLVDDLQILMGAEAREQTVQQGGKSIESHPAGYTFAAALGET